MIYTLIISVIIEKPFSMLRPQSFSFQIVSEFIGIFVRFSNFMSQTWGFWLPVLSRGESFCKVCTISFEWPVNYLCDAWHVFPPKYEAWTHFNRPWTEYQCQRVVWTLLIIFTESVNRPVSLSHNHKIEKRKSIVFFRQYRGYRFS